MKMQNQMTVCATTDLQDIKQKKDLNKLFN